MKLSRAYRPAFFNIMKYTASILTAAALLFAGCSEGVTKGNVANLESDNLSGDIVSVLTESFRYTPDDDITEVAVLNPEDGLTEYDKSGGKISESHEDGTVIQYEHDRRGYLKSIRTYYIDVDTTLMSTIRFKNRCNGDTKEQQTFDKNGMLVSKSVFKYDGDNVRITDYNASGDKTSVTELVFRDKNALQYRIMPVEAEVDHRMEATYDEDGHLLTKNFVSKYEGSGLVRQTLFFNEKGIPVKSESDNPDLEEPMVETYTYEYDSLGNWTKKEIHIPSQTEPVGVIRRTIRYRE